MQGPCSACGLLLDNRERDEERLRRFRVELRCKQCQHIVIYRSGGKGGIYEPSPMPSTPAKQRKLVEKFPEVS